MRLVDPDSLESLLSMKPMDLFVGWENKNSDTQPDPTESLHRPFSVDVEGSYGRLGCVFTKQHAINIRYQTRGSRSQTVYSLCMWASTAEWSCYARAYLYLEPYVSRSIDLSDILVPDLWKDFASSLSAYSRGEYIDSVTEIGFQGGMKSGPSESEKDPTWSRPCRHIGVIHPISMISPRP